MSSNKPQKHVAMRTCIATRVKKPKNELVRIVVEPNSGRLMIDHKGKIRARGANLDASLDAFDLMVKKNVLRHALKLEKSPSKEEYEELRKEFIEVLELRKFREGNKPVKIRIKKSELEKVNKV